MRVCGADYHRITAIPADANVVCVFQCSFPQPQSTHRVASLAEFEAPDVYAPDLDPVLAARACLSTAAYNTHSLVHTHTSDHISLKAC